MKNLFLISLFAAVLLTACGGDDPEGEPGLPTPTDVPRPVDVPTVIETAADLDGTIVEVQAAYWSDGSEQFLSHILMESYPPQIPKTSSIRLTGDVPAEVLAQLNQSEPPFGQVIWGSVIVTGEVHLDEETGQVTLEIITISAA